MATAFYSHPDCLDHREPPGHPEQAARLKAVELGLSGLPVERRACPMGDEADVLRCHPARYIEAVRRAVPVEGWSDWDGDTYLSPGSLRAALRGVGGACAAVDAVMAGEIANAFVAARPPGHHAESERAMGFCLFGTVAIAARRLLDHHGLKKVAIVDFDVHHGNGTQQLLWDEARVLFASSQQIPLFPGSGFPEEVGAHGQIVNVALQSGTGGAEMRAAYEARIFPALERSDAEFLLISAGFDAHEDDPLATLRWREADFRWLTERLCDWARRSCGGRVVSCLEGGYDLRALAASVAAHVEVLEEYGR
ncbi:histone deacetylase family protein [Aliigemmobacter aestuarii]|uniref:Histone deacetylase family protein n=1 Tax=Aliigemmobacter aestuarii TaxID=1445661 RepID=A0A4S3MS35_9RHOB|nr:histone deacetylase family protein [Gemmobacter aestuarii]THD85359.1 histone deacetylase family protein [Gemmobacter aestuarii]